MNEHKASAIGAQPWVDRFGEIPVIGEAIYAVNAAIPTEYLVQEAICLVAALAEIASGGINVPITATQAWLLKSDLRRVAAVLGCIEAQMMRAQQEIERRVAA